MGIRGRVIWIITGLLVAALLARIWNRDGTSMSMTTDAQSIHYRGQAVRLSRPYESYEEYKDDPNNIAPEENARVEKLVADAPIQKRFSSRKAMIDAVFALTFPGYGLGTSGEAPQPDGSVLSMDFVEIPRADRDRYLVFRGRGESYTLIDDFITSAEPQIDRVRDQDGKLAYSDRSGKLILTRTPSEK